MDNIIRISLSPEEAEIVAGLFSDGQSLALQELLTALPKGDRRKLSRKIRAEIKHSLLHQISARAYLEGRTHLHIQVEGEP